MAEVTYYFDVGVAEWFPEAAVFDGDLGTFASTATEGRQCFGHSNTCPGDDLGTITKVEGRLYGYGDGDDLITFEAYNWARMALLNSIPWPAGDSPMWSPYLDITEGTYPWVWGNGIQEESYGVQGIDVNIRYNKVAKGNTVYCAKMEIRVTYTPVGAKTTQYLAGLDCPVFPHEMDLMSDKLPCPLPY